MTNVVPFHKPAPPPKAPSYLLLTTMVDSDTPLEEGDLVAFQLNQNSPVMFQYWWGPTGRDGAGRFIKKGSPDECYQLDGLKFSAKDCAKYGFKILGKVMPGWLSEHTGPFPKTF